MTPDVVRINATIDRGLLARVDQFASRHSEDRSTAIRQLLRTALRQLAKDEAIGAYRQQRLSIRQLADALDLDIWVPTICWPTRESLSRREVGSRPPPTSTP